MAPRAAGLNSEHERGLLASAARLWTGSYAPDYVGFLALLVAYILMEFFLEPFHRMFFINDLAISFPHAEHERVPVAMEFVYSLFVPLAIIIIALIRRPSLHKYHVTILGFAIALILTSFLTDFVKNAVGRPRPDLVDRCKPAPGTSRDVLVTIEVCTETRHHVLHDGWRSFPSGHSSFAFAGLGYLSLFLAGQLRLFVLGGGRGEQADGKAIYARGDLGRALICLVPLIGAAMIAISRCQDYRHDVYDVCTGALLGWVVAYWNYRRYWPKLSSSHCDEPYPGPHGAGVSGNEAPGYGRLRDEEERVGLSQNAR
ncbi:putative pap2 superfamily protein [Phaeoacremonium minimum UCRPA7]|uniref:Putative pap2 superfamily protein n=1 Tax=Phaeoacremonium minimum (strain UCR-PA7) TaxID=1286976 RepID=R8BM96_PHAM7|nr:putative pap2 superfamily protein [Phaeoacremonium minimum UCRPA7]EOO00375.1 putative pap2 superfamily protein [Phaeoacremonium minimum UCRPA7]